MANSILYVAASGAGIGQPGNPNAPYALVSALTVAAGAGRPTTLWLSDGTYEFPACQLPLTLQGQVSLCGSSSQRVTLSAAGLAVPAGSHVSLCNMAVASCSGAPLLALSGRLNLTNVVLTSNGAPLLGMAKSGTSQIANALLNMNGCTVNLPNAPAAGTLIDTSDGGLIATSCVFNVAYSDLAAGPRATLLGPAPETGFVVLQNCQMRVAMSGSPALLIALHNVNTVKDCSLTLQGSGVESVILMSVDIPNSSTPGKFGSAGTLFVDGLTIAPTNLAAIYGTYNPTGYPTDVRGLSGQYPNWVPGAQPPIAASCQTPCQVAQRRSDDYAY